MKLVQKVKNWWDAPEYDVRQPMVFPRRDTGRTKPVKLVGPCSFPEACLCSGSRIHGVCPCNEHETYKIGCQHERSS